MGLRTRRDGILAHSGERLKLLVARGAIDQSVADKAVDLLDQLVRDQQPLPHVSANSNIRSVYVDWNLAGHGVLLTIDPDLVWSVSIGVAGGRTAYEVEDMAGAMSGDVAKEIRRWLALSKFGIGLPAK